MQSWTLLSLGGEGGGGGEGENTYPLFQAKHLNNGNYIVIMHRNAAYVKKM